MATNYTQRKAALDEIAEAITNQMAALERAKTNITAAETALNGLATIYGAVITEITQDAAAAPSDTALAVMKAEADKLVADYQTQLVRATSMKNAIGAL